MNFSPSQSYSPSEIIGSANNVLYGHNNIPPFNMNTPGETEAPNSTYRLDKKNPFYISTAYRVLRVYHLGWRDISKI